MRNSELKSFPDSRVSTIDVCELGLKKHYIKVLLEIDVTNAREIFRKIKDRDGKSLSLTAWLVKCISAAVSEHREAHAFLKSSRTMLIFHDIDISITVEKKYNFGETYECRCPSSRNLWKTFCKECERLDISYKMQDIIEGAKKHITQKQLSLF